MPAPNIVHDRLGTPAVDIAASIDHHLSQQTKGFKACGLWECVLGFVHGQPEKTFPKQFRYYKNATPEHINMEALSSAIHHLWHTGSRTTYAVDTTVVQSLADWVDVKPMNGEVFRRIPHQNPLVIFPEPLRVTISTGQPASVLGFFVHGSTGANGTAARRYCATTDPAMTHIGLMIITSVDLDETDEEIVRDKTGRAVGFMRGLDLTRITLPASGRFTLRSAVAEILQRFRLGETVITAAEEQGLDEQKLAADTRHWLDAVLQLCLKTLVYLTAEQAEFHPAPLPRAARRAKQAGKTTDRQREERGPRVLRVGWRLGAKLRKARARAEDINKRIAAEGGTGRRHPYMQRAGHLRDQPYGPGRAYYKTIFIEPYWVSADLAEPGGPDNRVVPVAPSKKGRSR